MRFRWDAAKAKRNLSKHRVSFDEEATVFHDPLAMIFPDDVASVVRDADAVNSFLRSAIAAMPGTQARKRRAS